MPRLKYKPPKYSLHKATGQAVVTIHGREHYLGKYGSPESEARYKQLLGEWTNEASRGADIPSDLPRSDLRLCELLTAYLAFAEQYYRKDGRLTGEYANVKDAMRPVENLYSKALAGEFGPRDLKKVRDVLIADDLSRKVINARVNRIRRIFKWGVENELVEPGVLQALQAVAPLKKGRTAARETDGVKPVPREHIDAILALVSPQVRAMIQVQELTGMRPGELVIMRPRDVDRSKATWIYRPASHKTEHHGIERTIFIGPKAQQLLQPFLLREQEAFLFSPREAMRAHVRKRRAESEDPRIRKNVYRRVRVCSRVWHRYSRNSYQNAIFKACRRAEVPEWGPNRLRHNAATHLREQFGIEAARVVLGHASAAMTEVYAEIDRSKAADIMAQVG